MTAQQVWREMSPEQRAAAAAALWADEDSMPQQVEAVQAIAQQLRSRTQTIAKLPPERLARHLAALRVPSASLASRALVAYHLAAQRPMLAAFLDHVGVAHEGGLISDTPAQAPDEAQVRAAVASLVERFPPADVRIYLLTLAAQDPDVWGALAPIASELAAGQAGAAAR